MRRWWILGGLLLGTTLAFGQTPDTTRSYPMYELPPIIVTAPRLAEPLLTLPWSADLLGPKEIRQGQPTLSLEEVLRTVPGLVVFNRNNPSQGDRVVVRGIGARAPFGVRGLRLLLDGIPLTMPDGTAQLNNINLAWVRRIEVIKGPSSALYGNAAGGVIDLQTRMAPPVPFQLEPFALLGSFGLQKFQGSALGTIGRTSYVFGVSRTTTQGFRDHATLDARNANLVVRSQVSPATRLTAVFNAYDSPYALNPSTLDKATADTFPEYARTFIKKKGAGKQIRQIQGGITVASRISEQQRLEVTVYGVKRSGLIAIPGHIIDLNRNAGGLRSVFSGELSGWPIRWMVGADVEIQKDRRKEFENDGLPEDLVDSLEGAAIFKNLQRGALLMDQDEEVLGLGPFAKLEWRPAPGWILHAGGRYDRYQFRAVDHLITETNPDNSGERVMSEFSPSFGVLYQITPTLSVFGNYATGFQTPTVNELGNRPDGVGGFNPDLKPEHIRSVEVGMKGMLGAYRLAFHLSVYRMTIRDMLIPYQIEGTEEVFYRNAGETRNNGLEIQVRWTPVSGFMLTLGYTAMDFEFVNYEVELPSGDRVQLAGNDVPGVPPHRIFGGLRYESPWGLYGQMQVQWVDAYYCNDFNGPAPGDDTPLENFINDAYTVVDLRLGLRRQWGPLTVEIYGGVNNLLDVRYNGSIVPNAFRNRFFEPAPGRNYFWGITLPYAFGG